MQTNTPQLIEGAKGEDTGGYFIRELFPDSRVTITDRNLRSYCF
jgi:hypothetical protein